jgi:SAM-dependent methyltransferase
MKEYGPATYGDRIAEVYDEWQATRLDTDAAVDTLAELAASGPALELGIGTGRIALPLAARGIAVQGIDASEAMVVKMRAQPGGEAIPVTMGDFADVAVEGRFSLIFVVFNTFFGLLEQDEQIRCFRNVADHLADDGLFVVEAFVPDPARFDRGQRVATTLVESDRVRLDLSTHDPVKQQVFTQHLAIDDEEIRLYPVRLRYAWPAELDLMARLAGLRLRDRWSDWRRSPFGAGSAQHVSVYRRS